MRSSHKRIKGATPRRCMAMVTKRMRRSRQRRRRRLRELRILINREASRLSCRKKATVTQQGRAKEAPKKATTPSKKKKA